MVQAYIIHMHEILSHLWLAYFLFCITHKNNIIFNHLHDMFHFNWVSSFYSTLWEEGKCFNYYKLWQQQKDVMKIQRGPWFWWKFCRKKPKFTEHCQLFLRLNTGGRLHDRDNSQHRCCLCDIDVKDKVSHYLFTCKACKKGVILSGNTLPMPSHQQWL